MDYNFIPNYLKQSLQKTLDTSKKNPCYFEDVEISTLQDLVLNLTSVINAIYIRLEELDLENVDYWKKKVKEHYDECKEAQGQLIELQQQNEKLSQEMIKLSKENNKLYDLQKYHFFCLKTCFDLLSKTKLYKYHEIISQYLKQIEINKEEK